MGYVLFVWSHAGYTLREMDGDPPQLGHELELDEQAFEVSKIGASPLPGDTRTCVFVGSKS